MKPETPACHLCVDAPSDGVVTARFPHSGAAVRLPLCNGHELAEIVRRVAFDLWVTFPGSACTDGGRLPPAPRPGVTFCPVRCQDRDCAFCVQGYCCFPRESLRVRRCQHFRMSQVALATLIEDIHDDDEP